MAYDRDREAWLMVARVNTAAFQGIGVLAVDVQVQMASGLPAFSESCERPPLALFRNALRRNAE